VVGYGKKSSTPAAIDSTSGGGGGTTPKALARLWTFSNAAWTLDLANAVTDGSEFLVTIRMSDNVRACSCGLKFNGTESSGTCTLQTLCAWLGGRSDPGCGSFGGNGFGMCAGNGYVMNGTDFYFTSGATYH